MILPMKTNIMYGHCPGTNENIVKFFCPICEVQGEYVFTVGETDKIEHRCQCGNIMIWSEN